MPIPYVPALLAKSKREILTEDHKDRKGLAAETSRLYIQCVMVRKLLHTQPAQRSLGEVGQAAYAVVSGLSPAECEDRSFHPPTVYDLCITEFKIAQFRKGFSGGDTLRVVQRQPPLLCSFAIADKIH